MSTNLTVRLEDHVKDRLHSLAEATHTSRSSLAAQAIRNFIELNEWQMGQIRAALAEAERGEFASDEEVRRYVSKWGLDEG
jgi:RHH-type transcriptional regulator, rel operon repressor / antitoxin RelB